MPSFGKPTNEQVDAVEPQVSSPHHEGYFFDHLQNPNWIEPLRGRGFFSLPPAVQREGGGIRLIAWPPSRYLVRMAKHAPDEVAKILAKLQTDNPSIHSDIIEAAAQMPPRTAATLVPNICDAVRRGYSVIPYDDANGLCSALASGGQPEAALTLADTLFAPYLESGKLSLRHRHESWYKEGLKAVLPVLVVANANSIAQKLCDWLAFIIAAEKPVPRDPDFDYSYSWRPAIEEHEQNRHHDLRSEMVGFVRDAIERAITGAFLSLADALSLLAKYPYLIYKRLRLHLINVFAEKDPSLARKTIMDRSLFDDYRFKHEYAMLVGRRLPMLDPPARETWFSWIDAGPDMSDFDEKFKSRFEKEPAEADRQARVQYWQFTHLHWVKEHIHDQRREFYQRMLQKHGEPELADLCVYSSSRCGSDSPFTLDELKQLPIEAVIDKVAAWHPQGEDLLAPINGIASTFRQYVATDPQAFSTKALLLCHRPAVYVRAFLSQMSEAVKAGQSIDLPAVLNLCQWVIAQPRTQNTAPAVDSDDLEDQDWQWTRDTIAELIERACEAQTENVLRCSLSEYRELFWSLIRPLTGDPIDSYIGRDPESEDPRVQDYLSLSINSPRGKALEAVFAYARWIANHLKKQTDGQSVVPGGFNLMPEVFELLELQLAPENSAFETRAAFGMHIGLLYWIDKEWLAAHAAQIFDLRSIEADPTTAWGWAAWNNFLVATPPHIEYFKLFREQFNYAVEQASQVEMHSQHRERPLEYFAQYLIILYGRGGLALDDENHLIRRFLTKAVVPLRTHAIKFVGYSLQDDAKESKDPIPQPVLDRFMHLWDWYWTTVGQADAHQNPTSHAFGYWFSCGAFPDNWAIERLEQFVEAAPAAEPDHLIVERLAEIAKTDVPRAVKILDSLIRNDKEGWRIHSWLEHARTILSLAMAQPGIPRDVATKTIDYLGRRGYREFGNLLEI